MSGFIFGPIVRVRHVGFLAIVRNVVCTNATNININIDNDSIVVFEYINSH